MWDNECMKKTHQKKVSAVIALTLFVFLHTNIASAESFAFARNMTLGSRGADVSALQQILITAGFLKITSPSSYFGPLTKTSLSAWQTSAGITPASGYFGPISRNKINTTILQTTNTVAVIPGCTSTTGFSTETGHPCGVVAVPSVVNAQPTPTPTQTTSPTVATNNGTGLPMRIKIPKISVDAPFQYNGLSADGSMEIPNNVVDVGWFTGSVRPGEIGTSVITGHVSQIRGGVLTKPGVFISLKDLRAGDTLTVTNDRGVTTTFVVRETRNYDPLADATDVFSANDNGAHMNIITCEGTWHPDQLSYSQRLVVFTDAVF